MKTASLDIDCQNGFSSRCSLELPVPGAEEIVAALNRNAARADFRVGSKDAHPPNPYWLARSGDEVGQPIPNAGTGVGLDFDLFWPAHCVVGTPGFNALPGLPTPQYYDFFVWKGIERDLHPYGVLYHDLHERLSTGLVEWLVANDVGKVIVGGLALEFCVKTSIMQLLRKDFSVYLNIEATRGMSQKTSDQAIEDLEGAGCIIESF